MMEKTQVQNWIGAQVVANIVDVTIAPVLIIFGKSAIKANWAKKIRINFL